MCAFFICACALKNGRLFCPDVHNIDGTTGKKRKHAGATTKSATEKEEDVVESLERANEQQSFVCLNL